MDKPENDITGSAATIADRPTAKMEPSAEIADSRARPILPERRDRSVRHGRVGTRTAAIKGEGGEVLFEQNDCEMPTSWSQLATNVVASKYFYGEVGTGERTRAFVS